jgi:hypothetical protein
MAARGAAAQEPEHDRPHLLSALAGGWTLMQDGALYAELNHQGGPRGGDQFVVPNWWMGMATKSTTHGALTFTSMLSLDPATVGDRGYRELFQSGEAFDGQPIVDRQHPHDFFMQLSAAWRVPLANGAGLTISGGPAGEPALGPTTYMHRASTGDNPAAPLSHHTFDSTHVSFGVATASVDSGRWTVEGSVFNGREPDQHRWDFDFGGMDSVSGRVWFRPDADWEIQASTGHLVNPEQLEPGNVERSTASVSWTRAGAQTLDAITMGYGRNDTDHGHRQALIVEAAHRRGQNSGYLRFESLQVETVLLEADVIPTGALANDANVVNALTLGAVHDVGTLHGFESGIGADVTFYRVPDVLQAAYGAHPVSVHVFFRLRPPAGSMGRMLNMRMAGPMRH